MKKLTAIAILIIFAILSGSFLCAEQKKAPKGFYWQRIKKLNCSFPVPYGWFVTEEERDGIVAVFISKENVAELGKFETGLTANVYRKMKNIDADKYAQQFRMNIIDTKDVDNSALWDNRKGPLHIYSCKYFLEKTDSRKALTTQLLTIVNKESNTLYILWFESPTESWEENWEIGKILLGQIVFDENM